jgi:mono/diheme cytochrome c family protein
MFANIILFLILIAVLIFFAWLTVRAWRSKRPLLHWPGVILGGILTLLMGLVVVVTAMGMLKLYVPRSFPVADIIVEKTPERIARGQYLASIICVDCHTTNQELPLSGGKNLTDTTGMPLGTIYAANLTPAGEISSWSDGEIIRAIREGTHQNGRPLLMPITTFRHFSDEDVQSLVAYLRSQPAVQNQTPQTNPSLLTALFLGAGLLNIDSKPVESVSAPPKEANAVYGEYVLNIMSCKDCHGANLQGGKPPLPQGPNLGAVKGWTQEQFFTAIRTGTTPEGRALSTVMPWKVYRLMDDVELAALFEYIKSGQVAEN